MPDKKKKEASKFIYNCVRCGQYCSSVNGVPVTLQDLLRWQANGELGRLVTHLGLETSSGFPRLVLKPSEGKERGCPVYDAESKDCGLYTDLPLNCQAYPLGFNGEKYFVVDQACQGLGEGEVAADKLRTQRDAARAEYEARSSSAATLPVMYGLVMQEMMDQSRQAMDSLSMRDITGTVIASMGYALGCTACFGGAIVATLIVYVGAIGSATIGAGIMLTFAIGVAIPFLLAAYYISKIDSILLFLARNSKPLSYASMAVIVTFGLILVTDNFHTVSDMIYPYLGLS